MRFVRGVLYAGGSFELGPQHAGVARLEAERWVAASNGLMGEVGCFEEYAGALVAGGTFVLLRGGDGVKHQNLAQLRGGPADAGR